MTLAVVVLAWAAVAQASPLSEVEREYLRQKGAIVFISQTNYPPFEFVEPDGNRAGMCIELARWMATTLGFQAKFIDQSFKQAQEAVLSGRADVLTSLFYSDKRAQSFAFTQITFAVPASIFVAAQRPDIKDSKDLDGKTIAMQSGDYAQEYLESKGLRFKVVWTRDFAEATNLVIAGQADAVIGDEQIVLYHLYSHQLTHLVKTVGEPLYVGSNCMAAKAGEVVLRGILDKGLALARASGTLEQINRKWLGVQYPPQQSWLAQYRWHIWAAGGVLVLITLLAWFWNLQLRRLVRRRTMALAENEAKYRALIETTDTGFVILDQEGRVLDANQEYARLTGHDAPGLIKGRSVVEWTHPHDLERNLREVKKCMAQGWVRGLEIDYILPGGGVLPVEINATVLESGGRPVILSVCRDISERRQAQHRLQESQAKFAKIFQNSPVWISLSTLAEGRYLDVNEAYARGTGWGREEVLGRTSLEINLWVDETQRARGLQLLADEGRIQELPVTLRKKTGEQVFATWSAERIEIGGIPCLISVVNDITQRKRAEEAMVEHQQRLSLLGDNLANVMFYQVVVEPGHKRRFAFVSGSVERLNEISAQAVLNDPEALYGQVLPQFQPELAEREAQSRQGLSVFRMEAQLRLPSGRVRWFDFTSTPRRLADGSVIWDGVEVDITERKQAEEALRVSEAKHRLVLQESTDPIFSFAADGTYLFVNQAFATPFGKLPQEIIGKRIWDIFPQDEADKRFAVVKAVFASGQTRVIEVRVPQPGEDLYFVTSVKPVKDGQGRVITVICISKDITERKKAEEALKESEERFRVISEESPLGISLLDQRGNYEYVNPAFVRMFGYTLAEIPNGEAWFDLLYPDPQERRLAKGAWLADLRLCPSGEARPRAYEVRSKDGSRKTILFRPVTVAAGRQVVIYEDVSERLKAEQALKEGERRYRELFESMSDLIYTQDLEGRFLSFNPAMAKLFGYEPHEMLGHKASDFMKPQFRQAFESEYLAKLVQGGHHLGLALYFAKDGGRRYIEYHSSLVTPLQGRPYISGVGRDVTERVESEKKLRRLQDQLFQSQKIEALGVLAGGIAHDFNNVLQAISGYTQLMLAEANLGRLDRERLEHIEQHVERATGMIRHLMTLARKGQTRLERVDLNQEVRRTVKILEHTLPRMIKIKTNLAADLLPVRADSPQMEQVLLNLSTNAGQAMPQGGSLAFTTHNLAAGQEPARAEAGLGDGDYVCLEVADSGVGMDEETCSHIFEPFFTTKPQGQGTGLGLSTVYGIVTNSGGVITCRSRPDQGSTFTIYLPAAPELASAQPAPAGPPARPAPGSETILVVDDELAILDTCRQALEERGYGVLVATSGEEALEIYLGSPHEVALVILDLSMPGMGGVKCLESILAAWPRAKVLVATGYADEAVTRQINALGAAGLIGKPYSFHDLLTRVRDILDAPA